MQPFVELACEVGCCSIQTAAGNSACRYQGIYLLSWTTVYPRKGYSFRHSCLLPLLSEENNQTVGKLMKEQRKASHRGICPVASENGFDFVLFDVLVDIFALQLPHGTFLNMVK